MKLRLPSQGNLYAIPISTILSPDSDRVQHRNWCGWAEPDLVLDGTWKLNAAKSDGGPRELPSFLTIKVTSKGQEFEGLQTTDSGEVQLCLLYTSPSPRD